MNKIRRVSLFFRIIFQMIFVILPLLLIFAWLNTPSSFVVLNGLINVSFIPRVYTAAPAHGVAMHVLSNTEKLLGFLVSMVPMLIELFMLYSLIQLFKLYEKGEIFSLQNVRYIRNVAYALLIGQLVNPFYEALMGLVLTWNNPPGQRFISITLDQTNIGLILIAFLVILISWIMAEGCKLQEEQQLTI